MVSLQLRGLCLQQLEQRAQLLLLRNRAILLLLAVLWLLGLCGGRRIAVGRVRAARTVRRRRALLRRLWLLVRGRPVRHLVAHELGRGSGHRRARVRGARAAAGAAERPVDSCDQLVAGQEHDLPERQDARLGLAQGFLEQVDSLGGGRLPDVVDRDVRGVEAEPDEVAVELLHVGSVAVRRGEVPVCGGRPVHQDHRVAVDLVQRLTGLDLLPDLREPGDRPAQAVVDGLRAAVAERSRLGVGLGEVSALDGGRSRRLVLAARRARRGGPRAHDDHDHHRDREDQRDCRQ